MPPGDVQAFDARTGEKVWEFHTIPQEGEYGNEDVGKVMRGRPPARPMCGRR